MRAEEKHEKVKKVGRKRGGIVMRVEERDKRLHNGEEREERKL